MSTVVQVALIASVIIAVATGIGVAYAVSRSASDKERREIDKSLITSQRLLIDNQEAEIARCKTDLIEAVAAAARYRADLTQKAAVDHLLEVLVAEEGKRATEHGKQSTELGKQSNALEVHSDLLRQVVSGLEALRAERQR